MGITDALLGRTKLDRRHSELTDVDRLKLMLTVMVFAGAEKLSFHIIEVCRRSRSSVLVVETTLRAYNKHVLRLHLRVM